MATFAEFIAQNFHSEADLIWRLDGPARAVAAFKAGSLSVEVSFEQREADGPWHVSFEVTTGDPSERTSMAFRVFNGVFQAVREFVSTRQPAIVGCVNSVRSRRDISLVNARSTGASGSAHELSGRYVTGNARAGKLARVRRRF